MKSLADTLSELACQVDDLEINYAASQETIKDLEAELEDWKDKYDDLLEEYEALKRTVDPQ